MNILRLVPVPVDNHCAPKQYRVRIGQENGVLGRREGKEGNRQDANPDGGRHHPKS